MKPGAKYGLDSESLRVIVRARMAADEAAAAERTASFVRLVLLVAFGLCAIGLLNALAGYAAGR